MLAFNVHLPDATLGWQWDAPNARWVNPTGWIKPFTNPALEFALFHDGACVVVVVRERHVDRAPITPSDGRPARPERPPRLLTEMATWPGEYLTVQLQPGQMQLHAGAYGTAPVYLTTTGDQRACGSWDLTDLRPHLQVDWLCDRAVARMLARQPRYTTDTLFRGVYRLTERAAATITTGGITITYPPAALHVTQPRRLRPDADPIATLETLLAGAVTRLPVDTKEVGVELSGGVDSANVAITVAAGRPQVGSYGLLVDGAIGRWQQQRRQTIIHALGLRDVVVNAVDHPPFAPDGARAAGWPHQPDSEYYLEAFDAAHRTAAAAGLRVVYTGIGGDELVALRLAERDAPPPAIPLPSWLGARTQAALEHLDDNLAPAARLHLPTLLAFTVRNPLLLRRGLWPLSPLADPTLIRLGESLPVAWRRDKRLLRQRLRRAGLPEHVTDPPRSERETFSELMQLGLHQHSLGLLKDMLGLRGSLLVDAGYLDRAKLRAVYERAQSTTVIPSMLADTIALELGLRSLA